MRKKWVGSVPTPDVYPPLGARGRARQGTASTLTVLSWPTESARTRPVGATTRSAIRWCVRVRAAKHCEGPSGCDGQTGVGPLEGVQGTARASVEGDVHRANEVPRPRMPRRVLTEGNLPPRSVPRQLSTVGLSWKNRCPEGRLLGGFPQYSTSSHCENVDGFPGGHDSGGL